MAYKPISGVVSNIIRNSTTAASGYYLKAFEAGTTTPLSIGVDSTPSSTLAKCALNTRGEPISNSADESTNFVPHINQSYKLKLFPTSTDADNDTNPVWSIDNISLDFDASDISITIGGSERASLQAYLENQIVADADAVRAISTSSGGANIGDRVWIEGFSDAWELKSGDKSADDNGWYIVSTDNPTTRYWESTSTTYDVTIFGASLDGTTPDDQAYLNCIATVEAVGGGIIKTPFSASGVMLHSSISFKDNITFDGGGNEFKTHSSGSYDTSGGLVVGGYLSSEGTPVSFAENCHIINCCADNVEQSSLVGRPFYLSNVINGSINRCSVKNNPNAFAVRRGYGNRIYNNYVKDLEFQMVVGDGAGDPSKITDFLIVDNNVAEDIDSYLVDCRNTTKVIVTNNIGINCNALFKSQTLGAVTLTDNVLTIPPDASSSDIAIKVDANDYDVRGNTVISEASIVLIEIQLANENSNISHNRLYSASATSAGIIRFTNSFSGEFINFSHNTVVADETTNYIVKQESGNTQSYLTFTHNTIIQGENQIGTSDRAAVLLRDMVSSDISHNKLLINRDLGGGSNQKGFWFINVDDSEINNNIVVAGTNGGSDRAIDLRNGSSNNKVLINRVETTGTAPSIDIETSANNVAFLNTENSTHTNLTAAIL